MAGSEKSETTSRSLRLLTGELVRCRPETVASLVERVLNRPGLRTRYLREKLFRQWEKVVGAGLLDKCRPLKIRGGILYLEVKSNAWAHQLIYEQECIITRVNELVGELLVTGIHCRIARGGRLGELSAQTAAAGAVPSPDYAVWVSDEERKRWEEELAARVGDPELRELLLHLRCRCVGRQRCFGAAARHRVRMNRGGRE